MIHIVKRETHDDPNDLVYPVCEDALVEASKDWIVQIRVAESKILTLTVVRNNEDRFPTQEILSVSSFMK